MHAIFVASSEADTGSIRRNLVFLSLLFLCALTAVHLHASSCSHRNRSPSIFASCSHPTGRLSTIDRPPPRIRSRRIQTNARRKAVSWGSPRHRSPTKSPGVQPAPRVRSMERPEADVPSVPPMYCSRNDASRDQHHHHNQHHQISLPGCVDLFRCLGLPSAVCCPLCGSMWPEETGAGCPSG